MLAGTNLTHSASILEASVITTGIRMVCLQAVVATVMSHMAAHLILPQTVIMTLLRTTGTISPPLSLNQEAAHSQAMDPLLPMAEAATTPPLPHTEETNLVAMDVAALMAPTEATVAMEAQAQAMVDTVALHTVAGLRAKDTAVPSRAMARLRLMEDHPTVERLLALPLPMAATEHQAMAVDIHHQDTEAAPMAALPASM